jgi:hypothetical protein
MFERVAQELFGAGMAGAGRPARTNGDKLSRVFHRLGAVEVLLRGQGEGSERKEKG